MYNMYDRDPYFWIDQPPTRERPRTRHRQKRSMANPHTQRSGKEGVGEGLVLLWLVLLVGEARVLRKWVFCGWWGSTGSRCEAASLE
jgi:hypothetical protein